MKRSFRQLVVVLQPSLSWPSCKYLNACWCWDSKSWSRVCSANILSTGWSSIDSHLVTCLILAVLLSALISYKVWRSNHSFGRAGGSSTVVSVFVPTWRSSSTHKSGRKYSIYWFTVRPFTGVFWGNKMLPSDKDNLSVFSSSLRSQPMSLNLMFSSSWWLWYVSLHKTLLRSY